MRVLIACEFSGIVRDMFLENGHDAYSCDLLPSEKPSTKHIQRDVLEILGDSWDLMIAHPPCTHLAASGARWFKEKGIKLREAPIHHERLKPLLPRVQEFFASGRLVMSYEDALKMDY